MDAEHFFLLKLMLHAKMMELRCVTVLVSGKRHNDPCSNILRGHFYIIFRIISLGNASILFAPPLYMGKYLSRQDSF